MEITITVNGSLIRTSCRGLYNYDNFYFLLFLLTAICVVLKIGLPGCGRQLMIRNLKVGVFAS